MFTQSSIVSSIDFDCDADYFAVAGVTKKIKIYDYQRVINRSINQVHSPSMEMTCQSKISCVAWNKYHKVRFSYYFNTRFLFCGKFNLKLTVWPSLGKLLKILQKRLKANCTFYKAAFFGLYIYIYVVRPFY